MFRIIMFNNTLFLTILMPPSCGVTLIGTLFARALNLNLNLNFKL